MIINDNSFQRNFGLAGIFFLYALLVIYAFLIYYVHSSFFTPTPGTEGMLFSFVYFFICVPIMLCLAAIKFSYDREKNSIFKWRYFIYTSGVTIPAIISVDSPIAVNTGMVLCLIVLLLIVLEFFFVKERA